VALSPDEISQIQRLKNSLNATAVNDELMLRYYQGRQRVEQLGMAIPPAMRHFLVVANWCRVQVDTINNRQKVRSLIVPGEETADPRLRDIADASNLWTHVQMFNQDRMIYGRSFLSVGTNEDDKSLPLVRVESPREMVADVDVRRERMRAAARFFGVHKNGQGPRYVTLYLPNETVWAEREGSRWVEIDRDVHNLGAVPVVMHLNRRMSGGWTGESQMTDVIPFADSSARALTNLQFAQEAHGIPRMFMTGVASGDFVDGEGKPIPKFEAYFNAIHTLREPTAKVGQLTAADLKNFETAITIYGKQAAMVTGFPARYFGLHTTNPPAEGAIRADEAQLVESVEAQNTEVGMTLGWVGALALRFATGEWVQGNRVRVEWHDPATPTVSQREDALAKRRAAGVLSREGYWDELGWSEARKAKEREYFEAEAELSMDPYLRRTLVKDEADAGSGAPAIGG
jgi:hypothetical protein